MVMNRVTRISKYFGIVLNVRLVVMLCGKYVCSIAFGGKGNAGYRGAFLTSTQKSIIDLQ